jgi:hypothetical protein
MKREFRRGDCFLRTHELIARPAARGIIVSQTGEHGWQERVDLASNALEHVLTHEPDAVCLATVDAHAVGPAALEQARRAQATIDAMVSETFTRAGRAQIGGRTWAGGIYRSIAALVEQVADDPILTSVCVANDFSPPPVEHVVANA